MFGCLDDISSNNNRAECLFPAEDVIAAAADTTDTVAGATTATDTVAATVAGASGGLIGRRAESNRWLLLRLPLYDNNEYFAAGGLIGRREQ